MITLREEKYLDLPEFIKDQIERELEFAGTDTSDEEEMKSALSGRTFILTEYDPSNSEDLSNLSYFLKQKIIDEGEPDMTVVDEIGESGQILDAILIEGDRCCEGRHRLQASIKYNLKIKAYIY